MNIQDLVNAHMSKIREQELSKSGQLLLGELKLKLESVKDKTKEIITDFGMRPSSVMSWRGSYCELGIDFSLDGGGETSVDTDEVESRYGDYISYKTHSINLNKKPTTQDFLGLLNEITNKQFCGYKGGDFVMHKNVAVYFAHYGESSIKDYKGSEYATVAPFDVIENENNVIIVTNIVE